jgi:hypothetical protein
MGFESWGVPIYSTWCTRFGPSSAWVWNVPRFRAELVIVFKMENEMKNSIQRVRAIRSLVGSNEASAFDVALAREYLRRVALMAKSLAGWTGGPFFDTTAVAAADLDVRIKSEIEAAVNAEIQPNAYVRRLCVDYLKWRAYVDAGNPTACAHANIYEPLMRLFERGHSIGLHHGELIVGSFAIPLGRWLELSEIPPADLDDDVS